MNYRHSLLTVTAALLMTALHAAAAQDLATFAPPWRSPYGRDPARPYQLVNREGQHLFILNKTAWA